jgi:hypothetical protein
MFPTGTQYFRIAGSGKDPVLIGTDPEANFDDPAVLRAIVKAVFKSYPAERRAIVLWDHGGSWDRGFGGDENNTPNDPTDDGHGMLASQVSAAVAAGLADASLPPKLDFVGFDTCLMAGSEVAYEFRSLASAYLACAEIDFGNGWDYTATLSHINSNSSASATALAASEVAHWDAHHVSATPEDGLVRAHAAFDLSKMGAYTNAWTDLAATMSQSATLDWVDVGRRQLRTVPGYWFELDQPGQYPHIRDARQFLDKLAAAAPAAAVSQKAVVARTALADLTLATSQGTLRKGFGQGGMHFEMPPAQVWATRKLAYQQLAWNTATSWSSAMDRLVTASDTVPPAVTTTATNMTSQSATLLPTIEFPTPDADIADGQVYLVTVAGADRLFLGLIGQGQLDPGFTYRFSWKGKFFTLSDGPRTAPIALAAWMAGDGAQISASYLARGVLEVGAERLFAFAAIDSDSIRSLLVEIQGRLSAFSLKALAGGKFTPVLWNFANNTWVTAGTTLQIGADGAPLALGIASAQAGSYQLVTSLSDVWGNAASKADALTLSAPIP